MLVVIIYRDILCQSLNRVLIAWWRPNQEWNQRRRCDKKSPTFYRYIAKPPTNYPK